MSKIKKISELPEMEELENKDVFLVSKQEPYNRKSSKIISYQNIVQSLRKSFEQELKDLGYINDNFVNDSTLSFSYDSISKKIVLKTDAFTRKIDATDFIYDGMIDDVSYDRKTHAITITFNTKSRKTPIKVDISDLIDTYSAGNGLSCVNNTFGIDTNVVSQIGHGHTLEDISGVEQISSDTVKWVEGQCYAKTEMMDGIVYRKDVALKYDKLNNTLSLSVGQTVLTTEISSGTSGSGLTYEDVKNELSSDGYGLNVVFRDWV